MIEFPEKLIITITEKDIQIGVKSDCTKCPIAVSAKRHFSERSYITVLDDLIRVAIGGNCAEYLVSRSALRFIRRFDKGKKLTDTYRFIFRREFQFVDGIPTTTDI